MNFSIYVYFLNYEKLTLLWKHLLPIIKYLFSRKLCKSNVDFYIDQAQWDRMAGVVDSVQIAKS
jgi:hypothetical protein